jgi:hypothetical protein
MIDRAALVERVADLVRFNHDPIAIANEAIDLIRAEVLEEAARVADALEDSLATEWREGHKCDSHLEGKSDGAHEVAAAIRALKETPCSSS